MTKDRTLPVSFSEPEAQRILARAAELEGSIGTRFTAEDLRQIAAKAGIEAHALEHAMNETVADQPSPAEATNFMDSKNLALLATTGVALGLLAVAADRLPLPGSSAIPVFAPSALFTIYRALRHPLKAGVGGLLRELAVFFGSFTAAAAATQGFDGATVSMAWSMMAGGIAVAILSLRGGMRTLAPAASPSDTR
jgi:hypothetical protein